MSATMPSKAFPSFVSVGALLAASALASSAAASGFNTARFGGEHGNPMTDNPTALYYNPAGLAIKPGFAAFADGNIAFRLASYSHTADPSDIPEPPDAVGSNNGESNLTNIVAAPMLGLNLGIPITDSVDLAIGAGFFVPFGGTAVWDENDAFVSSPYPGPLDGTQRWYSIHGTIRTMYISAGVAVGISKLVYIGVSGGVAQSEIDSLRARNANGDNSVVQEGRAWLEASKFNGHFGAGVMVTPLDGKLRIGASYQAPPAFGEQVLEGTLVTKLGPQISGRDQQVEVHQSLPDVFRLGVSYRLDDLELRLSGDYQRWSLFEDQCIAAAGTPCVVEEDGSGDPSTNALAILPRRWQDAGGVRLGASYWFSPLFELFGGVGYDSNAIPDENLDAALMDFHDVSLSLGGRLQPIDQIGLALSYTHFFYVPRDTSGKSVNDEFQTPGKGPDAGGEYTQTIGTFNVNVSVRFDPFSDKEPAEAKGSPTAAVW
jgi:long-chain fatty acid transport protein